MSSFSQSQLDNFQKNSNPNLGVTIVIPRMFNNLNWRRVKHIFVQANFGFVERIDVIPKGDHKTAYVHFAAGKWNMRSHEAREFLTQLQNGNEVQFVYDEPWYWKIRISNSERPSEGFKKKTGRKKTLDLSEKDGVAIFRPIKVETTDVTTDVTTSCASSPEDESLLIQKHLRNDPIKARIDEHNMVTKSQWDSKVLSRLVPLQVTSATIQKRIESEEGEIV